VGGGVAGVGYWVAVPRGLDPLHIMNMVARQKCTEMQGDLSHGSGSYRDVSWHGMQGGDEGHPCQGGVTALVSGWLLLPGWFVRSHGWLSGRGRVGNRYACFYHDQNRRSNT
jgi:hypothetical protein